MPRRAPQLVGEVDVVGAPHRVEQPERRRVVGRARARAAIANSGTTPEPPAMSCTGRVSAGLGAPGRPHEERAERPVHLELVAGAHLVDEVGRDLAVGQLVDGERHPRSPAPDDAIEYERIAV